MRSFHARTTLDPVPSDVVALLRRVDLAAGAEARHQDQLPELLRSLREEARIQSVTASSAIEGVIVADARASTILAGRTERFRTRSEAEFAGYTAALDYLQGDVGELSVGLVLHLHRLLFSRTADGGGVFKTEANVVVDRDLDGVRTVRFQPAGVAETPFMVEELVTRAGSELDAGEHHPLLVIAAFVLDLLCIHPFTDGNGRVARLLTTYLLDRSGYGVGRYVSIEQLFFDAKDGYYVALGQSTTGWFKDGRHDLWPWARFLLTQVAGAYDRFSARIAAGTSAGTKQGRVRDYVLLQASATFTINDIRRACPGISDNTIRLTLNALRAVGHVEVDGTGRNATWHRT